MTTEEDSVAEILVERAAEDENGEDAAGELLEISVDIVDEDSDAELVLEAIVELASIVELDSTAELDSIAELDSAAELDAIAEVEQLVGVSHTVTAEPEADT